MNTLMTQIILTFAFCTVLTGQVWSGPGTGDSSNYQGQELGEVDRLLQSLARENKQVVETCLERCKTAASDGVMNGKRISKPQPSYPPIARTQRIEGDVSVRVVIDETGKVIAAQAVSGPAQLQAPAVAAARKARFSPTQLSGVSAKVKGIIIYNFVAK